MNKANLAVFLLLLILALVLLQSSNALAWETYFRQRPRSSNSAWASYLAGLQQMPAGTTTT